MKLKDVHTMEEEAKLVDFSYNADFVDPPMSNSTFDASNLMTTASEFFARDS